jgi:esterase/lipase superfamily enzyme
MPRRPVPTAVLAGACALIPLLSACGRGAATTPVPVVTDTVWYISARARDGRGRDTHRFADSLEYGLAITQVEPRGDPLMDRLDLRFVDSTRMTASEFAAALRSRAQSTSGGDSLIVVGVHGFGTSLREALAYAAEARVRARSTAPWVAFCWPSKGSGAAWPRAGQFFSRAYRDDSTSADASRPAFAKSMQLLLDAVGGRNLLVVAHSMGSQLVGMTLSTDSTLRVALATPPHRLRGVAFVAPDIPTNYFGAFVFPRISELTRRLVVYASLDDRMLMLSRSVNDNERLGLLRETTAALQGVETVDATEGAAAESATQRMVGTHHAVRRESATLFDLHIVARGYTPECRATVKTAMLDTRGLWKLTADPLPPLSALAACKRV